MSRDTLKTCEYDRCGGSIDEKLEKIRGIKRKIRTEDEEHEEYRKRSKSVANPSASPEYLIPSPSSLDSDTTCVNELNIPLNKGFWDEFFGYTEESPDEEDQELGDENEPFDTRFLPPSDLQSPECPETSHVTVGGYWDLDQQVAPDCIEDKGTSFSVHHEELLPEQRARRSLDKCKSLWQAACVARVEQIIDDYRQEAICVAAEHCVLPAEDTVAPSACTHRWSSTLGQGIPESEWAKMGLSVSPFQNLNTDCVSSSMRNESLLGLSFMYCSPTKPTSNGCQDVANANDEEHRLEPVDVNSPRELPIGSLQNHPVPVVSLPRLKTIRVPYLCKWDWECESICGTPARVSSDLRGDAETLRRSRSLKFYRPGQNTPQCVIHAL
ncbi:uncharacterized protein FIBRA_01954 [Fibroporia radiculosa]|uniref:Uncharacterized protein n=1 Tax=Fibroporia radiculosa TaxID=599839 RepID=J4H1J6_9APHY|nr:uncharacterized protein FIBRA_01954 [Fibroporia radiculosa]CCL99929.1 predicted protein [Fibroporia radiculosa]